MAARAMGWLPFTTTPLTGTSFGAGFPQPPLIASQHTRTSRPCRRATDFITASGSAPRSSGDLDHFTVSGIQEPDHDGGGGADGDGPDGAVAEEELDHPCVGRAEGAAALGEELRRVVLAGPQGHV